ncbi:MAG: PKD domain-containing protein [Planctomycetes bacterium]|nr:PKD domain-containing protein [Planctomycetota bacterium]
MLSRTRTSSLGALLALALALPAAAQSPLCTPTAPPWASNNGGTAGGVVFYDLNVINAVRITGFDCNLTATVGTSVTLELYTTPTTYVGQNTNAGAWTLVGTAGPVLSAARESATSFTLASPVILTPGSYGIGYRVVGGGQAYSGTGTGAQVTTSNADLSLTSGAACSALFSGSFFSFRNWNGCIHYTLADGLFANFSATPTSGPTPLSVNFTDTSFTSDPNGVQTWAWDLDGDNVIDSNAQNPSFTYSVCGPYDVTLTVTNTLHPSSTVTKNDFIFGDPQLVVAANFSATPTSGAVPLNVNFTDTSTGSPTSWSWDLDGDSIPDSAAQNPSFSYTVPGTYTVSLTASNGCFSDAETKTNFIIAVGATSNTESPELLEYQFNEVRGNRVANTASTTAVPGFGTVATTTWQTDAGRPYFKGNEAGFGSLAIDNTTPYDNYVQTGWPLSIQGSHTIMFWMRYGGVTGTAYPFGVASTPTSARCWKSSTTLQLLGWGQVPTTTTAAQPSSLTGWQHYCVVVNDTTGTAQWYLNGVANGTQTSFAAGTFNLVGGQFLVGSYSTSRTNNITRFFDMDDFRLYSRALTPAQIVSEIATENPTTANMEAGCVDSNSFAPTLTANGAPQIGNLGFALVASGLEPARPAAVYIGLSAYLGGFLPLDLSGSGIFNTGCNLLVSPDIILNFPSGSGTVVLPAPIPIDPTLQGGHTYNQVILLGSGPLSAVSNAVDTQMQF